MSSPQLVFVELSHFKLRVTMSKTSLTCEELQDLIHENSYELAYVKEHEGESNMHYHFYLITHLQEATLRKHLRKYVGKGNESWSLSRLELQQGEVIAEMYLSYMTKEGNVCIPSDGKYLTNSALETAKAYHKHFKTKSKQKLTRTQRLENYIESNQVQSQENGTGVIFGKRLVNDILHFYQVENLGFDRNTLIKDYNKFMIKYYSGFIDIYMDRMSHEFILF